MEGGAVAVAAVVIQGEQGVLEEIAGEGIRFLSYGLFDHPGLNPLLTPIRLEEANLLLLSPHYWYHLFFYILACG